MTRDGVSACSVMACSVIGSAHRRQTKACQDASLSRQLRSPRGEELLLLAVADGHGGNRYWLSEVGSRLACERAAAAVAAALANHALADLDQWQALLASTLPEQIQAEWLSAIEADWRQRPEAALEPFAPLTYGSTLGLVVLAPGWWGCTGLGDWDLVRLDATGAELVSEEAEQAGAAEATASLCLANAANHWQERARLEPLSQAPSPFTLLLSSDGVRKSCATDTDFLSLCRHLACLNNAAELAEGLAQITAAGSGDDVSVAIGHWPPEQDQSQGLEQKQIQTNQQTQANQVQPEPARARSRGRGLLSGAALLLGLTAGAIGIGRIGPPAGPPPAPTPEPGVSAAVQSSLELESQRLCRQPKLITATLTQRKPQFLGLVKGALQAQALMANAERDPLGGLIAISDPQADAAQATPAAPSPLGTSCVELRLALAEQWRLHRRANGKMPR